MQSGWRGQVAAILIGAALAALIVIYFVPRVMGQERGAPVSVALVLAVDVSASINGERFQLQRQGYAAALTDPRVLAAVQGTPRGRIALAIVEWAGTNAQRVVVPWTVVAGDDGAARVAAALLSAPRSFDGLTAVGEALRFAPALFDALPWPADRLVIDVSGDGTSNDGGPPAPARDAAIARGIVVNGIAILADAAPAAAGRREQPLDDWYREHVAGGPGAFVVAVEGFDTFGYALVAKLVREVAGVPPPTRAAALR